MTLNLLLAVLNLAGWRGETEGLPNRAAASAKERLLSPEEAMDNVIAWCSGSPSIYPFYWIDPAAPNARELGFGGAALEGVYRTGLQRYLFGGDNAQRKVPTPDGHEIDKNKV